jgi:predicted metalloenzyme YecM
MLPDPEPFLEHLFAALHNDGVDVADLELDHICYRVDRRERYTELRDRLAQRDHLLIESVVGGRPIATFRLNEPVRSNGRVIEVLELPSPKISASTTESRYQEGFEHVEFVTNEELADLVQRHPELDWDLSALSKETNPDVRLRYDGFSVKFHRRSLVDIIAEEQCDHRAANGRS